MTDVAFSVIHLGVSNVSVLVAGVAKIRILSISSPISSQVPVIAPHNMDKADENRMKCIHGVGSFVQLLCD